MPADLGSDLVNLGLKFRRFETEIGMNIKGGQGGAFCFDFFFFYNDVETQWEMYFFSAFYFQKREKIDSIKNNFFKTFLLLMVP